MTNRPTAERRVALCVDDYGMHEGIDAAVLRLAALGRVNAVSCLVGEPAWPAAGATLAARGDDRIDIGLHLDLTQAPLQPGVRRPLPEWILRAGTACLPRTLLRAEIDAQFDAFEAVMARPPDHVDGHQHVHQLPGVRELLIEAMRRRWPAHRPWLRSTRPGPMPGFKPRLIAALGAAGLARLAAASGFPQNRHLLGVYGFTADAQRYRRRLATWLHDAQDGDLLMCHPSLVSGAATDPILPAREAEAELLCGNDFDALLARESITLAPISRIRSRH